MHFIVSFKDAVDAVDGNEGDFLTKRKKSKKEKVLDKTFCTHEEIKNEMKE